MEPQKTNLLKAMPGKLFSKKINKKKMVGAKNDSQNYETKSGTITQNMEIEMSAPCLGYARRSFFLRDKNNGYSNPGIQGRSTWQPGLLYPLFSPEKNYSKKVTPSKNPAGSATPCTY